MGFSESVTQMIMFIAVVTIASSLVFIFNSQISQSVGAVTIRQQYLSNQMRTAIQIESVRYNDEQIVAFVKNVGDSMLHPNQTTVYVNNERIPLNENVSHIIEPDTDIRNVGIFDPNEILKITINKTLDSGLTNNLLIITQYNGRATYDFGS